MSVRIEVSRDVLQGNKEWAARNRSILQRNNVWTLNMMSSPGAGKTSILEHVIPSLKQQMSVAVIEGDVMTTLDAERICALGVQSVQINTQGACHLDAKMIYDVIVQLPLQDIDLLLIENVGNLVCPADFELGEDMKIAVLSITEGEDKVEKYPYVFQQASAILLNKIDLLPYLTFDVSKFHAEVHRTNPNAPIFRVSARTGEGLAIWNDWLIQKVQQQQRRAESD
jgi:hydrogenase nickel incorporation protein HypB